MMFERIIAFDWSGRSEAARRPPIVGVQATAPDGWKVQTVRPKPRAVNWRRREVLEWLSSELAPSKPRSLVALDFAFGLPWPAHLRFGTQNWRGLLARVSELCAREGSCQAAAECLNLIATENRQGGPFWRRDWDDHPDRHLFSALELSQWRLTDSLAAGAISPWYLGPGSQVALSTLSGLWLLHQLLALRDSGSGPAFEVWPHETGLKPPEGHALVEIYPALYPNVLEGNNVHVRDARRTLNWLIQIEARGEWDQVLAPQNRDVARACEVSFADQVRFEGWILGVGAP